MTTLEQVIDQMQANGLPLLPAGHPIADGKVKRFGKGKKAWYCLRELDLRSGKRVITGAFGMWQGQNPNTVPVRLDGMEISAEERQEAERKQKEYEAREAEKKQRMAQFAACRARMQWGAAESYDPAASAYLVRKKVTPENVRIDHDGTLLIPARIYGHDNTRLVGLQKVMPDGTKLFNKGMEMVGAALLLGEINADTPLIQVCEGYATGRSARMAHGGVPVVVAFNAGNLLAVAQGLRRDFPNAHILFLADDDHLLEPRLLAYLAEEFDLADPDIKIDGFEAVIAAKDGAPTMVTAWWRTDGCGVAYIEADIRAGRQHRIVKFENAGISRSKAAAKAIGGASVVAPLFADRGLSKWSDFNDLHVEESLEAVRCQIEAALDAIAAGQNIEAGPGSDPAMQSPRPFLGEPEQSAVVPTGEALLFRYTLIYGTTDIWDGLSKRTLKRSAFDAFVGKKAAKEWFDNPKKKIIQKEALPTLIRGAAVEGGAGGGSLQEMLDNLTLLRGTETVWDMIGRQVMTLGAVRANYTAELTAKWQERIDRKTVEQKNLVFDPTQTVDLESHVNIFFGWPLVPKEDMALVDPIIALIQSLCSAEDNAEEVLVFMLRWMALPLQRPGAKLQTALLVFGEKQGTGKSLLFDSILRPIYGEYGTTVGQHQLESGFTDWRSRKLFTLFEEVLSRDDKFSHNGTLKYMITGKRMQVNPKNLPLREENNHMNCAFLSNEPQPIPIELEDRRFCVVQARAVRDKEFYNEVVRSIENGGIEAFYHFLLNYPLDDFNEHTKPPMTRAKERVISFGRASWDAFYVSWRDGFLDAPYCSCLTSDLYIVYKRWCDRNGEKPLSQTKFSGFLDSRETKVKREVALGAKPKKSYMVFEIVSAEGRNLHDQCTDFREKADVHGLGN